MPLAAGMFCTTTVGLSGRYLPTKRPTSRAPTSVTPPATEPTIMRTLLPRKEASSWASAVDTRRLAIATSAVASEQRPCRERGLLPPPLAGEGWGEGRHARVFVCALSLSLPRKRGRGRRGASLRNARDARASCF